MDHDLARAIERNQQLVGIHLQAENAHRMEETLATLHPECVFEDLPLGVTYRGREGARQHYRIWWEAFDVTVQGIARHWTTTGDMIAEARYLGHHVGSFYGLEATQRTIDLRFAVFITFADGFILGEKFYYDLSGLLQQLGVARLPRNQGLVLPSALA
jgi:steroid delta-isomerase-like uncharacterized protein